MPGVLHDDLLGSITSFFKRRWALVSIKSLSDLLYRREFFASGLQSGERLLNSEGGSTIIVDSPQIDKDGFFPPKFIVKFSCSHEISCSITISRNKLLTDNFFDGKSPIRISTLAKNLNSCG